MNDSVYSDFLMFKEGTRQTFLISFTLTGSALAPALERKSPPYLFDMISWSCSFIVRFTTCAVTLYSSHHQMVGI